MWYRSQGNKFNAKRTDYNGEVYHSKMEAGYAAELDLLVKGKVLKSWERQVKISFNVCPDCKVINDGDCTTHPLSKQFHLTNYYIDFIAYHKDGTTEYIEVKGMETGEWKMKWRLLEALYGNDETIKLTVIK